MGFTTPLKKVFDFIYKATFENGLHEYEFDHVFTGIYDEDVKPDPGEVSEYCFMDMDEIKNSLVSDPGKFTAWFVIAFPRIEQWRGGMIEQMLN